MFLADEMLEDLSVSLCSLVEQYVKLARYIDSTNETVDEALISAKTLLQYNVNDTCAWVRNHFFKKLVDKACFINLDKVQR